jgi:hypothetical protein
MGQQKPEMREGGERGAARRRAHRLCASLVKAGRYGEAVAMVDLLTNPNTAVAPNYRGYATRKLGRIDEGASYYLRSVACRRLRPTIHR